MTDLGLDSAASPSARSALAKGGYGRACTFDHVCRLGIVRIAQDMLDTGEGEQHFLAGFVFLHVGVLHATDVIGIEIGKDAGVKADAVHAVQLECLRGHLHDHVSDTAFHHLGHVFVQIQAFGRGIDRGIVSAAKINAVGAYVG